MAVATGKDTVALHVRSGGGEVAGAFECARMIRGIVKAAGKRFVGYTDGTAASAAYALIAACDEIYCAPAAVLGSIGTIGQLQSAVKIEGAMGLDFRVIKSGARKADGNPHIAIDDAAVDAAQMTIDAMAAVFFAYVAERRPGIPDPSAFEAGVFVGQAAVDNGLSDGIRLTLSEALATPVAASAPVSNISMSVPSDAAAKSKMADKDEDKKPEDATRAGLVTASESDDPDKARRAKAALAAYDSDDEEEDKDKKEAKAAAEAAAKAHTAGVVATMSAQIAALTSVVESFTAKSAAEERASFLATRPDLSADLLKSLEPLPLATVKAIVATVPVTGNPLVQSTATPPVAGVTAGNGVGMSSPDVQAALDRAMGLAAPKAVVLESPYRQTFSAVSPGVSQSVSK
jgi:ClpP class serine protease